MVRFNNDIRLIVDLICSALLIVFLFGMTLVAAAMVGLPMALGAGIVIVLGIIGQFRNNQ